VFIGRLWDIVFSDVEPYSSVNKICIHRIISVGLEVLTAMTMKSSFFGESQPPLRKNKTPPSSGSRRKPSKKPALSRQQSEFCLLGSKLFQLKSKYDLQQNILKSQTCKWNKFTEVFEYLFFFLFAPIWELAPLLEHRADFSVSWSFTDGRTPWTGDQLVARPLPKYRTTQTQKNAHTHQTSMPWVGFEPTIPGLRASEDSICLRQLGYRDRLFEYSAIK
jgi:hypothetical protein